MNCEPKNERYMPHKIEPPPPVEASALAELARVMNTPVDMASIHDKGLVVLNAQQLSAYQKAQRIVAELAKANTCEHSVSGVDELIANCRAIAEEGDRK